MASDASSSIGRVIFLSAVPAIALTLMATLALQQDSPRRQLASDQAVPAADAVTSAPFDKRYDVNYTLYIMSSADDAQRLPDLGARGPELDWYAYVSTPKEVAELMRARELADWIRYAAGLPPTRIVDLRLTQAGS